MKKIRSTLLILFIVQLANAQTWDTLSRGIGSYCGGYSFTALCLAAYNDTAYLGGAFNVSAGNGEGTNCIGKWDGKNWDSLGYGTGLGCSNSINALIAFNGLLVAGGSFDTLGHSPQNSIAAWNGTKWSSLDRGIRGGGPNFYGVQALCVYNGNLYVGGGFDSAGAIKANNIAMWNGSAWSTVGGGVNGTVFSLYVYNGNLYVGGSFDSAGAIKTNNIAAWNGTKWTTLSKGINGVVNVINSFKGELYAGGSFDSAGNVLASCIAKWDSVSWTSLGNGISGPVASSLSVCSMAQFNNYLYTGGTFDTAGGLRANSLALWDGSNWSVLINQLDTNTYGIGFVPRTVYALLPLNNSLYVAGSFDSAAGMFLADVAVLNLPAGIQEISRNSSIEVHPNPSNGIFGLQFSRPELVSGSHIIVYDELGSKVYDKSLQQAQGGNQINLSSDPPGVYFYQVISEKGELIGSGKLVKE